MLTINERKEYWDYTAAGLLTAFGSLSIDMYLPAFPAIALAFNTDVAHVQYTLAFFNAGLAIGQLFYGPLSDRYGRRPALIIGLCVYVAGSADCAMAPSVSAMVALRFLQAVGGCTGMVIARAIVRARFDGNRAAHVFSLMMLVMGAAPILAPTVGGILLTYYSWHFIFWLLMAIGVITFVLVVFALPESLPLERRDRLAIRRSLANYRLILKDRSFVGYSLSAGMVQAGMFTYIAGSAFVFMHLFQLSTRQYGMLFGINACGLIACSQINNFLLKRIGYKNILDRGIIVNMLAAIVLLTCAVTMPGNF